MVKPNVNVMLRLFQIMGSAPAPGAIFRALAENPGRTERERDRLSIVRAGCRARGRARLRPGRACSPVPVFFVKRVFILFAVIVALLGALPAQGAEDVFAPGRKAYSAGQFTNAARFFQGELKRAPSAEAWHNFGDAAWQAGHPGEAVLAWQRALWINPYQTNAAASLRFVNGLGQFSELSLAWTEKYSTWLPANLWAGLAAVSLWLAVALVLLPGIFRWRKSVWPQLLAAVALGTFVLTLPALAGIHGRTKLAVIREANEPLRQTPTQTAQVRSRFAAGEMVRCQSVRGKYFFVRTANEETGWVAQDQLWFMAGDELPPWPAVAAPPESAKTY